MAAAQAVTGYGVGGFTLAAAVLAALVWGLRRAREPQVRGDELEVWPFEPRPFMTAAEVRFMGLLRGVLPEFEIFAQVQLSRLVDCPADDHAFWFNRINRMSADYVLVHPDLQHAVAVIELDDWSHSGRDRQRADRKKDKAILSAGLGMIRFDGSNLPSEQDIRTQCLREVRRCGFIH